MPVHSFPHRKHTEKENYCITSVQVSNNRAHKYDKDINKHKSILEVLNRVDAQRHALNA